MDPPNIRFTIRFKTETESIVYPAVLAELANFAACSGLLMIGGSVLLILPSGKDFESSV
jgi:hypothetical protein